MTDNRKSKAMCFAAGIAGAAVFFLQTALFHRGMDAKGLLISGHPLTVVILVLTAAMATAAAVAAFQTGKGICAAPVGKIQAVGSLLLSLCLLGAITLGHRFSGAIWVLGTLAALVQLAAALSQWQGKQPSFLTHGFLCLFLAFYLINRYQIWSQDPQLPDYLMNLLGSTAMMVYSYQMAAGNLSQCSRRTWVLMGSLGAFFCLAGASLEGAGLLCLGGGLWMLAGLWSGTTEGVEKS